jgi:hypothetical protein
MCRTTPKENDPLRCENPPPWQQGVCMEPSPGIPPLVRDVHNLTDVRCSRSRFALMITVGSFQ